MSIANFSASKLINTLTLISGAKAKGATSLEILTHFLLTTKNGEATFSMTNLDVAASVTIEADLDGGDMNVAIPFVRFSQLIASRKGVDKPIKVVQGEDKTGNKIVTLKQGRWKAQVKTMDAEEYPLMSDANLDNEVVMDVDVLSDAIKDTIFCTATDYNRPSLYGVHIKSGESLSFQATDGFRLAVKEIGNDVAGYDSIVSSDTLHALSPLMKQADNVTMGISQNSICFFGDGWKLRGQLVGSPFPDTSPLLKIPNFSEFQINSDDVKMSLSGAAAFGAEEINFEYSVGTLKISMVNEYGEVNDEIEVEGNGVDLSFKLNPKYVSPILNRRDALTIKSAGTGHAIFFISEEMKWIVMPLHRS